MHQTVNHDASTQAMTEVALGLSMAFFSLLILALFSVGMPKQTPSNTPSKTLQSPPNNAEKLKLASAKNNPQATNSVQQQFVFYFNGHFYNAKLNRLNPAQLSQLNIQQPLILAVPNTLPLTQIMALRKQIKHPNTSITVLNQTWQQRLEQMP